MSPTPASIETAQLLLRPFTLDDAEAYWPLLSLPAVLRYVGEAPRTSLDEVRSILQAAPLRDYAVRGYGRMACIDKHSGKLVGFSGLKYLADLRETDIGYRFLPECWGRGYATESAQALIAHGRAAHGLGRIVGLVDPANGASRRVLGKLGLAYERDLDAAEGHGAMQLYATVNA
jgi:RimJ/RimL family protein N-acetyltransferase